MTTPCIITVAITGSVPKKSDNPAVPVTVTQQIESTHEAFEAGATIVHVHVRDEFQNPSSDPKLFEKFQTGIKKHCPGMIIQFSTGGRGRKESERGAMLKLKPEMASLATGSVNFPNSVYENHPDLILSLAKLMSENNIKPEIEVFDLAMLYNAYNLMSKEIIKGPVHIQFVFGIYNALPASKDILIFELNEMKKYFPNATWTAAGIGRNQLEINEWSLDLGGNCRTGLEDNIRFDKSRLARSNAELVKRVADMCSEYERHPASPIEARKILGLEIGLN